MIYAIVADWDKDNIPTRTNSVSDETEAKQIVEKLKVKNSKAFYTDCPTYIETVNGVDITVRVDASYWIVNSANKTISADNTKRIADATKDLALNKINELENQETPRRLAESILSDDGKAWLTVNREKIATERAKL